MIDKPDDGGDKPLGYVTEDGCLEVRESVDLTGTPFRGYHETELGQHMRWMRQAPDLYERFQKLIENNDVLGGRVGSLLQRVADMEMELRARTALTPVYPRSIPSSDQARKSFMHSLEEYGSYNSVVNRDRVVGDLDNCLRVEREIARVKVWADFAGYLSRDVEQRKTGDNER